MKAILSYGNYLNLGKQYQVKFVYENETEIKKTTELIKQMKDTALIKPYYQNQSGTNRNKNNDIIRGTNIPKNILLPFISMLISLNNIPIVIGNKEYTSFNESIIEEAINKLHIRAVLYRGNYFEYGTQYYITFKYANSEQQEELLYELLCNMYPTYGENSKRANEGKECIIPFPVDKSGNPTLEFSGIIGGTNIPEDLLQQVLKTFVEQHGIILTVGNEQFKDTIDKEKLKEALCSIKPGRARVRNYHVIPIN